ncbi:hypothetical protein QYM36_014109 [Artemia franciscana]|uniref:RING-type domain-containing protein n=1 Tax=Artemia franciscana TaxID=6661 RepID=A0AA88L0L9_ARTSF|nr:hypothetical protein QYM36_014109 [Artemia franciscana]
MACPPCQRYFCAGCTTKSRFNTDVCRSCRVLLSHPLDISDVKRLKIKDLQHFLNLRGISHENIIEKEDLVRLVMVTIQGQIFSYDSNQDSSNSGFSNPNYDLLVENDLTQFNSNPGTSSNPSTPDLPVEEEDIVVSSDESDIETFEEYPCPELTRRGNQPPHFTSVHTDGPENLSDNVRLSDGAPSDRFNSNPGTSSNPSTPDLPVEEEDIVVSSDESDIETFEEYPCPELTRRGNQPPHFTSVHTDGPANLSDNVRLSDGAPSDRLLADGPITLSQIQTESQLFQLSVRQLREILTTNRVDYRGLIEKSELFEKVVRLWNEIRSAKGADNLPDEELCKICMNAPVNCVILECGHMVSCVECGRQLAECPICRQFVVRVVRTFKA